MSKKAAGIVSILAVFLGVGCKYNSEEALYNCPTVEVRYATTITNLLEVYRCKNCHNSFTAPNGADLSTYAGVKAEVDNGRLLGSITHSQGFSPMPQGSPKMSDCDIKRVKAWIDAGAPNN